MTTSLEKYDLNVNSLISCTTDNCPVMNAAAKELHIWRIPCVCHLLNLIFKEFVSNCMETLKPFFTLLESLSRSSKYTIFSQKENIKKVPSYIITRWTSFCETVLVFINTKEKILEFCLLNDLKSPSEKEWKKLSQLKNLCIEYKRIINFFEGDHFGASGFFLCYIDLITDKFIELDKTTFKEASKKARQKIKELKNEYSQFWKTIAPIALLLNPCVPYKKLLNEDEIHRAKLAIIQRMHKYEPKDFGKGNKKKSQNDHPDYMNKYYDSSDEDEISTLDIVLKNRKLKHDTDTLWHFWHEKINASDPSLAYVAFDILGIVITSVSSERSFSKGRLIINDQRTRISSEHAKAQMIVQINKETAEKVISRTNIFEA